LRKSLITLRRVLIGISLSFLLVLSQGKFELFPISADLAFAGNRESLILQEAAASDIFAEVPLNSTPSVEVTQLVQQALTFYQAGQFDRAIALWQQAAKIYQDRGDNLDRALMLSYLSLTYQQLGEWTEATHAITQSLNLIENSQLTTDNSQLIFAHALTTRGNLQFARGDAEAALATWKQATELYQQIEDENRTVGSLINQAQAQQALGLFSQARQTLDQVEQMLQPQPNSQLKAMGLRSLGNIRLRMGDLENSRRVLEQSLAIAAQLTLPQDIGATRLSLGDVARAQKDSNSALSFYQQAATPDAPPLIRTQAQLNQLSLLLELGKAAEGQSLVPAIQMLLENLPSSRASIYARINLAQSLQKMGNREQNAQAVQTLAAAIELAKSSGDRPAESYALGYLGGMYEQTQQWSQAQTLTEQALLVAQAVNAPEIAYQWQWQLGRIFKARGETASANLFYQAAFTSLRSIRSDLIAASPDVQFSFRERVEPVYREWVDLLLQKSPDPPSQDHLKQAREVIEALQLAELDNFFRTACLEGQTVAIDTIDQTGAAVIYPIILTDRLEIILSLPGEPLRQYTALVTQQALEETVEQWRRNLEKPLTTPESKVLGQQVYDWLIRPMEAVLEERSIETLVFVLDGALRNVPMAAMYDNGQYLIDRYSIALTPGLRLLDPQPLQQQKLDVLAAGLTEERHGFSALINVSSELQEIQAEFSSRILLNQAFTSLSLQEQIQALPFPVVHLATHGQFSSNADETFVLAWDKPIAVTELSALLRQREEVREDAIELLVLSACETASGDKRAALGLAGVAVQAGARSTLASLWSLDDESGALFIGEFYRALSSGDLSKAEALRQAQVSLLRDRNFRHPRYWAPYVLVGNWL
jgi:CHAT domain-containing protein